LWSASTCPLVCGLDGLHVVGYLVCAPRSFAHVTEVNANRRDTEELQRVIRERIVIVTMDVQQLAQLWIVRDYLPELLGQHMAKFPSIDDLCRLRYEHERVRALWES
jgi:hypothetical protein